MRLLIVCFISLTCLGLSTYTPVLAEPVPYFNVGKAKRTVHIKAHTAQSTPNSTGAVDSMSPVTRVLVANKAALLEPRADAYLNAIQIYPFLEGALYRLYTAPEKVSDIVLQAGEKLIAISAGDTARWVIGDTYSGDGESRRVHILVKPYTAGLRTNLVITTNIRAYHLQIESTPATAMAAISWTYPQDDLIARKTTEMKAEAGAPTATGISVADLQFRYAITGDKPAWRPLHVFDDGQKVYIEFPPTLAQGEAPPLFVIGDNGQAELINYRISRNVYIVDRLFAVAELRLGGKRQSIVRISRTDNVKTASKPAPGIGGGHD